MGEPLKVLFVGGSESDARQLMGELERGLEASRRDVVWRRVDSPEAMGKALEQSDFALAVSNPTAGLGILEALTLWRTRGPDGPFMVVSPTISQEEAAAVMRAGACDVFAGDRLACLGPAVERELPRAEGRRKLRLAEAERDKALQAWRRSEGLFHDLCGSAPAALMVIDAGGIIRAASLDAERLLGYEAGQLGGRPAADLFAGSARPELGGAPGRPAGARAPGLRARRRDGTTLPIELDSSPMAAQPGAVAVCLRDITDRRRLEEHFRRAQRLEWLGRLCGGFAHDLNNLLGVIAGYGELLAKSLEPQHSGRRAVEQVRKVTERAAALVLQLLSFVPRRGSGPRELDLNAVVEGVRGVLSRVVDKEIDLALSPGEDLGRIHADPTEIEQILVNLALNARDAMPGGGRLAITTRNADLDGERAGLPAGAAPGGYVCLAVTDTGQGMSHAVQARAFEPFFTTREPGQGAGLGLTTVRRIVEETGGFIRLESGLGRGTTLTVYLPRVDSSPGPTEEAPPAPGLERTVLLVDNEASFRELVEELLGAEGYKVLAAGDPREALQIAERHEGEVHLLLTDVVMPGMAGGELARRLRERRPDIRVVYMSGYTREAIPQQGQVEPEALLISKPFTPESLARKLREALGHEPGERG